MNSGTHLERMFKRIKLNLKFSVHDLRKGRKGGKEGKNMKEKEKEKQRGGGRKELSQRFLPMWWRVPAIQDNLVQHNSRVKMLLLSPY